MYSVSVIICTHNPNQVYIERTLEALKLQTLMQENWELLLIDNKSDKRIADSINISWHLNARNIVEEELGLTAARVRGIKESNAEILVFVDDDNVLAPNYLEEALSIARSFPSLGVWGGSITGEYEVQPPKWFARYAILVGVREIAKDRWSNFETDFSAEPIGAGMVVRSSVAGLYARNVELDFRKKSMDRKGKLLNGSGDIDLAYTAFDLGFGIGVFKTLKLIHLIPSFRLEESYIARLAEGSTYSTTLLQFRRKGKLKQDNFLDKLRTRKYIYSLKGVEKRIALAVLKGRNRAMAEAKGI